MSGREWLPRPRALMDYGEGGRAAWTATAGFQCRTSAPMTCRIAPGGAHVIVRTMVEMAGDERRRDAAVVPEGRRGVRRRVGGEIRECDQNLRRAVVCRAGRRCFSTRMNTERHVPALSFWPVYAEAFRG